jgi:hypothetical protein
MNDEVRNAMIFAIAEAATTMVGDARKLTNRSTPKALKDALKRAVGALSLAADIASDELEGDIDKASW